MGNTWAQDHACYDDDDVPTCGGQVNIEKVRWLSNSSAMVHRYHFCSECSLEADYEVSSEVLGHGACGDVVIARSRSDDCCCALKTLRKQGVSDSALQQMIWEAEIHLSMSHPNIIAVKDIYECDASISMLTEYCEGGELYSALQQKGTYSNAEAAEATWQILLAVQHLHSQNIVHRDLKLDNFLYQTKDCQAQKLVTEFSSDEQFSRQVTGSTVASAEDFQACPGEAYDEVHASKLMLIDFGFARIWDPSSLLMTPCGTIDYASPELLSFEGYTTKTDMWSVGVMVFMLLAGYPPFHGGGDVILSQVKSGRADWSQRDRWQHVSEHARDFVSKLLTRDPTERLDAQQALRHPWFASAGLKVESSFTGQSLHGVPAQIDLAGSKLRGAALQALVQQLDWTQMQKLRLACFGVDGGAEAWTSLEEFGAALHKIDANVNREVLAALSACCDHGVNCFELTLAATRHQHTKAHTYGWLGSLALQLCEHNYFTMHSKSN